MNDKTIQLLEALAAKLGTTAEYLWGVLIRQAAVSATIDLVCLLVAVTYLVVYTKWLRVVRKGDMFDNEATGVIMGGCVAVIVFILALFCVSGVITGYMNPEYWALNKILDTIQ